MSTGLFINKPYKILLGICALFVAAAFWLVIDPLVLSSDSLYGFLAYKGTLYSHSFNTFVNISPSNINSFDKNFVSWWSPGQWMLPGSLNYFFGINLGVASILITILSNFAGLAGYRKLFGYFNFTPPIILFSLLTILCSSTFYYSYFIYQGGEVLEFAAFPWFCLYVLKYAKTSFGSLAILTVLFVCCFIAKSTLILYCTLAISGKIVHLIFTDGPSVNANKKIRNSLLLLFPIVASALIIYAFYLSKGNNPGAGSSGSFHLRVMDILNPLSSPLHSILSIRQWLSRIDKIAGGISEKGNSFSFLTYPLYTGLLMITITFLIAIKKNKSINKEYKINVFLMYGGVFIFFFISYGLNSNIGYDGRHYKLLGYLFVPAFLVVLSGRLKTKYAMAFVGLFVALTVSDFIYLKHKWTAGRYKSINYFYRHYDNHTQKDTLDKATYQKLVALDRQGNYKNDKRIFFIQSDDDIALDLKHQCAIHVSGVNFLLTKYYGKGPVIIICLSKTTLVNHPDLLKTKFPDYTNFKVANETAGYFIFIAAN